jgi:hypothetical protein
LIDLVDELDPAFLRFPAEQRTRFASLPPASAFSAGASQSPNS